MDRIKVIIVTPNQPDLHEFFQEEYASIWDCQRNVYSIDDMANGIEDGSLSDTSQIIVFDDNLIEDNNVQELSEALATYAPYALAMVLSYQEEFIPLIAERTEREMARNGGLEAPFFIVQSNTALEEIDEIIEYNEAFLTGQEDLPRALPNKVAVGNPAFISDEELHEIEKEMDDEDPNQKLGYVICSTSSKGGSGKSTVALTLATTIAQASQKAFNENLTDEEPLKVCVVDMDIFDGQLGMYIGQLQPTALNIRVQGAVTPESVSRNLVYDESMMIHALLAPKRGRTAEDLPPEFYKQVIETLRTMFDLVILDTSVQYLDPLISKICLPISDAVLFIANLSAGAVFGMTRWITEVTSPKSQGGIGINNAKIGIVLNQVMDNVGMDKKALAEAALNIHIISQIPMASQKVISASNYQRLNTLPSDSLIGPSYYNLAQVIVRGMSPKDKPIVLAPLVDRTSEEIQQRNNQRKTEGKAVSVAPRKKRGFMGFGAR